MASNSFGRIFRITTFGESHGAGIGVVIDGCPAGLHVDTGFIQKELNRRRPGQSDLTTPRNETDQAELLSGVYNDYSTGAPIAFFVRNQDQRSSDYNELENKFRPGHADITYQMKYGHRDHRGGGRSSARETIARVIGGAVAKLLLTQHGINITAFVSQVGSVKIPSDFVDFDPSAIEASKVRCPHPETAGKMESLIQNLKTEGNTIGGTITCFATGIPNGLGEPVYDKLQSTLASAMLGINAAKGFDYGSGFDSLEKTGRELNDPIIPGNDKTISFRSNNAGGILGGISTGQPLNFRVAFKPVSTIGTPQESVNSKGEAVTLSASGRHDPCVLPRAVPIVEAMCALVLADHLLISKANAPLK